MQLGYQNSQPEHEESRESRKRFANDGKSKRRHSGSIGSNRYQNVADEDDEGLDFAALGRLVKETDSSFDAYDSKQFPKNRIDPSIEEQKQFIPLENPQNHGTVPSRQHNDSRNSRVDSVPDAYFQTFLDPSNNNSR